MRPTYTRIKRWATSLDWGSDLTRRPYDFIVPEQDGQVLLHLYSMPRLPDDAYGWTIYQDRSLEQEVFYVHAIRWRQEQDVMREIEFLRQLNPKKVRRQFADKIKEPTVETYLIPLETAWWKQQQQKLRDISFSFIELCRNGVGKDLYGIVSPNRHNNFFLLQWGDKGPDEWQELVTWANECMAFFRQLIPDDNQTA